MPDHLFDLTLPTGGTLREALTAQALASLYSPSVHNVSNVVFETLLFLKEKTNETD